MFLLIDFMNPQGSRGFTSRLDKIKKNLDLIEPLKSSVEQKKQSRKDAVTVDSTQFVSLSSVFFVSLL